MRSTGERWTLGHRPALDGVRGIAILLVLGCHMTVPGMSGAGALGVTLFFVLSGFLITALLLEEHERRGSIDLRRFYQRRARRLLPALLASTVVAAALMPILGPRWLTWGALPPVLLYYANWVSPELLAALNGTWSLAVEEQFYTLWPLLLLTVVRRGRRAVVVVACIGVVVSVTVRVGLIASGAPLARIYDGTDSVAFALLAGAALAAWQLGRAVQPRSPLWLVAGLALLLTPSPWPFQTAALISPLVAGAAGVLVLLGVTGAQRYRWLESQVLVWFGQRSYGLYLWHIGFSYLLREMSWPWPAIVAAILPLSLMLAEASYRWVEMPFRQRRARSRQASGVIPATTVHEPSSSFTFSG